MLNGAPRRVCPVGVGGACAMTHAAAAVALFMCYVVFYSCGNQARGLRGYL